ncbi:MAG: pantoate--beta-alanine ligase [Desulfomonilaceae bacterium]
MDTFTTVTAMKSWATAERRSGNTIGFVPTMGYLHEGHLSLIHAARRENDRVAASIFVNPTQFGRNEDLSTYPRDPVNDAAKCAEAGVDALFMPDAAEIYGPRHQTYVEPGRIAEPLCGRSRPGHFRGVATVVLKLFNIVNPTAAYFGAKDYQQLQVIRSMVQDLNVDVRIVSCPTVREPDGLAMSSRNSYLTPAERRQAVCLYQALCNAKELFDQRVKDAQTYLKAMNDRVRREPDATPDYISLVDPETLEDLQEVSDRCLAVMAVRIGKTRLIDNMLFER